MSTARALHAMALAVTLCYGAASQAATVPPGTVLHAKQEIVRNNGSEP